MPERFSRQVMSVVVSEQRQGEAGGMRRLADTRERDSSLTAHVCDNYHSALRRLDDRVPHEGRSPGSKAFRHHENVSSGWYNSRLGSLAPHKIVRSLVIPRRGRENHSLAQASPGSRVRIVIPRVGMRDFSEPPRKDAPRVGHSHLCGCAAPREQSFRPERLQRRASPPLL